MDGCDVATFSILFHRQSTGSPDARPGKALEIALSENPTVKVADKEIEKKKYAQKGSYAALFPQVSFTADYTRTLKNR